MMLMKASEKGYQDFEHIQEITEKKIKFLNKAAHSLFSVSPSIAEYIVFELRENFRQFKLPDPFITKNLNQVFCSKCYSPFISGVTARIRVVKSKTNKRIGFQKIKQQNAVLYHCLRCNKRKYFSGNTVRTNYISNVKSKKQIDLKLIGQTLKNQINHQKNSNIEVKDIVDSKKNINTSNNKTNTNNTNNTNDNNNEENNDAEIVAKQLNQNKTINQQATVQNEQPVVPQPELTEEEKKRIIEEKLVKLRQKTKEDEEQREREREVQRRESGKKSQESVKKWEEEQTRREVEQKKKEKLDDQLAKQRIKDKIEQDKINRRVKAGNLTNPTPVPKVTATVTPAKEYTTTTIQISLLNGQKITAEFSVNEMLIAVYNHVKLITGTENFSIVVPDIPRKTYKQIDCESISLKDAKLVPRASVIISR
eukprot:TRINITY_DN551_c0_g1_i4.p1 TRINITY_DN551_c0_g1~~TRINITY_DN551_c0_g1_i4.p1  ORF type:complete len:423 (-),score=158.81 TRINITY_DN551_c0_g1_i4:109-1377(-)